MIEERAISIFKNAIERAGLKERIKVSGTRNELADIMVYKASGKPSYLALNGTTLFSFSRIDDISYEFGEYKDYSNDCTYLQFVIKLKRDTTYIIEYRDSGFCCSLYYNGWWIKKDEKIEKALKKYNSDHDITHRFKIFPIHYEFDYDLGIILNQKISEYEKENDYVFTCFNVLEDMENEKYSSMRDAAIVVSFEEKKKDVKKDREFTVVNLTYKYNADFEELMRLNAIKYENFYINRHLKYTGFSVISDIDIDNDNMRNARILLLFERDIP